MCAPCSPRLFSAAFRRAQSTDGSAIPTGTAVRVADVQGTRVIVAAVDELSTSAPDEVEQ